MDDQVSCPECGSHAVRQISVGMDEGGLAEYHCDDCGNYFVGQVESDDELVRRIIEEGKAHPMSYEQETKLLRATLVRIRASAIARGDQVTLDNIGTDEDIEAAIEKILAKRDE